MNLEPAVLPFSQEQLTIIEKSRVPQHVAIIPDGNRRWAREQDKHHQRGHRAGANILIDTVKAAKAMGIRAITFYLFSTENWNRPQEEVAALMWLLEEFLKEKTPEMIAEGVKLNTIGDISSLPENVITTIKDSKEKTAHCNRIDMILALNYGGRNEICRAVQKILEKNETKQITEEMIADHLDTAPWGDPDLLIRTSGEMRISNFLLWQLSYTELYVTNVLWPDFTQNHLLDAVIEFQKRERRLGGKS